MSFGRTKLLQSDSDSSSVHCFATQKRLLFFMQKPKSDSSIHCFSMQKEQCWPRLLMDWCIFILHSPGSDDGVLFWTNSHPLRSWLFSKGILGLPQRLGNPFVFVFFVLVRTYRFSATRGQNCYNFKTAEGRKLKFRTLMGNVLSNLCANFWAVGHMIRVSQPKVEKPIGCSPRSNSKTECGGRIKLPNLEALEDAVSAPTFKFFEFRHFFLYLFIFFLLLRTIFLYIMIILNTKLCTYIFVGARSRSHFKKPHV